VDQRDAAAVDAAQRKDSDQYLHARFGSGYEAITGFSAVIEHEDRAAKVWLLSSVVWFIVVTTFGLWLALGLIAPEIGSGVPWLVWSRVRPCHVEGVIYAWLTTMYFGAVLHFMPRLLGTKGLWSESLGVWTAWIYDAAILAGFIGILTGATQGREYAEFPWVIDIIILGCFVAMTVNLIMTVAIRRVRPLYVSVWWSIAAPIWVTASVAIENVIWRPGNIWGNPSGFLALGHHDAMINWWGNHNLFGLWLTPILIAVVYYYVPRMTNTPLYSQTLSLISFWGLVLVYAAVGDHHLLQSPTPGWLKTIAAVNSVAILVPVFAFFTNVFLTMRGQWHRFLTNLPLRFVMTGFTFYILVNILGAQLATQPFNVFVHFTYYVVGHAHLALLGGFTILGMGVIYWVVPHLFDKPPYSRALAEWQYWLVTGGWIIFFTSLTIAGFIQGQAWMQGVPETNVLPMLLPWNIVRAVAGIMIYSAAWIQGYNIFRSVTADTSKAHEIAVARDAASAFGTGEVRA
jgi:cbb3-type cytochrome c oxidase subunit I